MLSTPAIFSSFNRHLCLRVAVDERHTSFVCATDDGYDLRYLTNEEFKSHYLNELVDADPRRFATRCLRSFLNITGRAKAHLTAILDGTPSQENDMTAKKTATKKTSSTKPAPKPKKGAAPKSTAGKKATEKKVTPKTTEAVEPKAKKPAEKKPDLIEQLKAERKAEKKEKAEKKAVGAKGLRPGSTADDVYQLMRSKPTKKWSIIEVIAGLPERDEHNIRVSLVLLSNPKYGRDLLTKVDRGVFQYAAQQV